MSMCVHGTRTNKELSDLDYAMLHMQIGNLFPVEHWLMQHRAPEHECSPLHVCTTFEMVCGGREELVVSAGKQQHFSSHSTHTFNIAHQLSPPPASIIIIVASPSHN